jgi:hypothetical protein
MKETSEINLEDFTKQQNDLIREYEFSNQLANKCLELNQISFFKRLILNLKMFLGLIKL